MLLRTVKEAKEFAKVASDDELIRKYKWHRHQSRYGSISQLIRETRISDKLFVEIRRRSLPTVE